MVPLLESSASDTHLQLNLPTDGLCSVEEGMLSRNKGQIGVATSLGGNISISVGLSRSVSTATPKFQGLEYACSVWLLKKRVWWKDRKCD
jgi:hypothetical protein